mgnify:FL=1
MKLKLNGFENEIEFEEETVNVISVNNVECFRNIISSINSKILGEEINEVFLLNDEKEELDMNKEVLMVLDVFNIDYNSKKILSKIYELIEEKIVMNQDFEIDNKIFELRNYIIEEINELPFEFIMKDEIKIMDILKMYSLKIDSDNYNKLTEKIEFLIDIISTLKIAKILIIPNMKLFLTDEEVVEVYKYSLYNNVNLLIIERNDRKKLKYEKKLVIDENFYDYFE